MRSNRSPPSTSSRTRHSVAGVSNTSISLIILGWSSIRITRTSFSIICDSRILYDTVSKTSQLDTACTRIHFNLLEYVSFKQTYNATVMGKITQIATTLVLDLSMIFKANFAPVAFSSHRCDHEPNAQKQQHTRTIAKFPSPNFSPMRYSPSTTEKSTMPRVERALGFGRVSVFGRAGRVSVLGRAGGGGECVGLTAGGPTCGRLATLMV